MLSGDIRGTAMDSLEHGVILADVRRRHEPQPADQPARKIGKNVTVEIRRHNDVKVFRMHDQIHTGRIDNFIVRLDLWVCPCDLSEDREEQTICEL